MRKRESFLDVVVTGATLAMAAPAAFAQEMERVPARLSAFLPRSPLPLDLKHMTSDDSAGCRGIPGTCHGRCDNDEFCGTLLSSDGKRYCGCRPDSMTPAAGAGADRKLRFLRSTFMVASFFAVEQNMPQARCLHQGYRDRPCLIKRSDLDVAAVVDHSFDCLAHLGLDAGDLD
jgi:hypothetical protein